MKQDSNLDFDGMTGNGVNRAKDRFAGNQHQTTNPNALINKGRGPTGGGTKMPTCDMEMFKGKPQVRQAVGDGATRAWSPSAGQNYKGNPDRINEGRGPTKGNQR
jgi:hypothetical protein